jgi:hypothetical protein
MATIVRLYSASAEGKETKLLVKDDGLSQVLNLPK